MRRSTAAGSSYSAGFAGAALGGLRWADLAALRRAGFFGAVVILRVVLFLVGMGGGCVW